MRVDETGTSFEDRRKTFDEIAELYDRFRPGYSAQLVDDVVRLSGIPPRGRILEIGSGTGKATRLFAERGYGMVCIEPLPNMARIAAAKVAAFGDTCFELCTFEEWQGEEGAMDLVVAAQSFHFLDTDRALAKVALTLKAAGTFAAFSNHPVRRDSDIHRCVQAAYERRAPELAGLNADDADPLDDRLDASGLFEPVVAMRYQWSTEFTAPEYMGLMETQSHHRLLPRDRRDALLEDIHDAITGSGGSIAVDYVTRLHLARRRRSPERQRTP